MSSHLIELANEVTGQATPYTPTRVTSGGSGSHHFQGGNPVILEIDRAGTTNALAVYGADAGDPNAQTDSFEARGDGTTVNFDAPAAIVYAAFSNYNWIVEVNGVVKTHTTDYTVTNPSGTVARIAFVAAPASGAKIVVHKVAPVALHNATTRVKRAQVRGYDFMWVNMAAASSASSVYVRPLAGK